MDKTQSDSYTNGINSSGSLKQSNYERQGGAANTANESNLRSINKPMESSSQHLMSMNFQSTQPYSTATSTVPQVGMNSAFSSSPQHHQSVNQQHILPSITLKTRMRVSKACDRCRNQKIKCSGTNPCSTCLKQNKECNYSAPGGSLGANFEGYSNKKIKLESPISDNNNSNIQPNSMENNQIPASNDRKYINHLENRVQYLESILLEDCQSNFKELNYERYNKNKVNKNLTLARSNSKWRYLRRHQILLPHNLCKMMYENLSEESKKQVVIPRSQYFGWNMSGCNYLSPEKLPGLPTFDLPSNSKDYIDYFFREINSVFAILHEKVFRNQISDYEKLIDSQVNTRDANERDAKTNQTRLFLAILYLVYALAIRFREFQKPDGPDIELLKLEEQLFKYSYQVISVLSFEWESFELIQSWLLISLYLRVSHRQTSSHLALGRATVMSRSMGLGQVNPHLIKATSYEMLKSKRIFWCVYMFDRLFGLQSGRYCGFRTDDITRQTPTLDYELEKDNWLTLPAFAMIHIARIANFVHTSRSDELEYIKLQQINSELEKLNGWLNENGFHNDSLFDDSALSNDVLSLAKSQVKLHYYDLVSCIHGKSLFNYIGKQISNHGLKSEMLVDACNGIIEVLDKTQSANLLFTPWYLVLSLLFDSGIAAITLINGGVHLVESKKIIQNSIRLITILSESSVKDVLGKIILKERFTMAKECLWALKMTNHILALRMKEDFEALTGYGIDHGSSDVNRQLFDQFGVDKRDIKRKTVSGRNKPQNSHPQTENSPTNPELDLRLLDATNSPVFANNLDRSEDNYLIGNLQWFDQWLDFNYEI